MIIGIGVDVVSLSRFQQQLQRTPALRRRLFTEAEQQLSAYSLAARFAAKEAVAKVLSGRPGMCWQDCEITREPDTPPRLLLSGTVATAAAERGITTWHLSLSHDGDSAVAMVVAEG